MEHVAFFVLTALLIGLGYIIYVLIKDLKKVVYDHHRLEQYWVSKNTDLEASLQVKMNEVVRLQGVCARLRAPKSVQHIDDSEIWERMSNLTYIRISDQLRNKFEAGRVSRSKEGISLGEFCFLLEGLDYCFQTTHYIFRHWSFSHYFEVINTGGVSLGVLVKGEIDRSQGIIDVHADGVMW